MLLVFWNCSWLLLFNCCSLDLFICCSVNISCKHFVYIFSALFGAVLCFLIMFLINYKYAALAVGKWSQMRSVEHENKTRKQNAPPSFRVPFTFASFPLSESLEQAMALNEEWFLTNSEFTREVVKISVSLDPVFTGLDKFLKGQKLARIHLSFTREPRNRASFWTANSTASCKRICTVPCKRVEQVSNSSVQKFVRARVNRVLAFLLNSI